MDTEEAWELELDFLKTPESLSQAILGLRKLADVDELVRHRVWDQHGLAFQLKKLRGFDIPRNVTPLVEGFWDSNIDTRANPLFTLARGSRFLSKLPKSERPPE